MTRALLEQIVGGKQGEKLRRQLAAWNTDVSPDEVDDALQEACARAERSCRGQVEAAVYSWLRTTAHRELARQRRRRKSEPIIDVDLDDIEVPEATMPGADVTIMAWSDRAEAAYAASVVLDRLSERQRDVVALHARGLHRRQIAEHLRLTPRTVKRLMEQVLAIGRDELVRLAGSGCDTGERMVARLAFGLAGASEARRAQLHLATCARCGALYERLDVWRENVAALLPVPPVAANGEQTVERAIQVVSDALSASAPSGRESPGAARGHAGEIAAWLREQATAVYYRTVDPTPLAGARPGAVAAAVAGCIAVGGGATYCAREVGGPISALSGLAATTKSDKSKSERKPAREAPARVRPAAAQAVTPPPVATRAAPPPPPAVTPPPPPPPPPPAAAEDEFEPSLTSATTVVAQPKASSSVRRPMPAPRDGPAEFGGP